MTERRDREGEREREMDREERERERERQVLQHGRVMERESPFVNMGLAGRDLSEGDRLQESSGEGCPIPGP